MTENMIALVEKDVGTKVGGQQSYPHTDLGNAQRLVERHGRDLHYCHPWGKWLVWDGLRWKLDDTGEVMRRAKQTARAIYHEASALATRAAQEQEEKALEERRRRGLEESRAAAGGVIVQSAVGTPTTAQAPETAPQEDPVATLQNLKAMLDAGLITADEYEKKKAEILSRM